MINLTTLNGATQIRPASHTLSRDMKKQFLAAMLSKKLQKPETPLLQKGSILAFDYRVLHRGTANKSNERRC